VWSLVALGVVGALVGTVVALSGSAYPPWPKSIAPIAAFVSKDRQLAFVHTVPVHFMSPKQFDAQIAKQDQPANRSQRADIDRTAAEYRALGLIGGAVNLTAAQTSVDAGGVLAYYDQDKKDIVVRGTVLNAATKETLAHELTHTLQDQHFDLTKLDNEADTADSSFALTGLVEGDAVLTQGDYSGSLPASEQRQADAENNASGGSSSSPSPSGPTNDASFLDVNSAVPYVLGPDFTLVLYFKGQTPAINSAFEHPPATELDILNPAAYLLGTVSHKVSTPALPSGSKRAGSPDSFGAFDVYMTLAGYMDARTALLAADGWGGGSVVQYTQGGRTCTRFDVVGQSTSSTMVLEDALSNWSQSLPLHQATVAMVGQKVDVTACDPGKLATVGTRSRGHALDVADERSSNIGDAMLYGVTSPKVALCVGDQALGDPTLLDAEAKANSGYSAPSSSLQSVLDLQTLHLIALCRGPNPPPSL
jgi:hypothetical protein